MAHFYVTEKEFAATNDFSALARMYMSHSCLGGGQRWGVWGDVRYLFFIAGSIPDPVSYRTDFKPFVEWLIRRSPLKVPEELAWYDDTTGSLVMDIKEIPWNTLMLLKQSVDNAYYAWHSNRRAIANDDDCWLLLLRNCFRATIGSTGTCWGAVMEHGDMHYGGSLGKLLTLFSTGEYEKSSASWWQVMYNYYKDSMNWKYRDDRLENTIRNLPDYKYKTIKNDTNGKCNILTGLILRDRYRRNDLLPKVGDELAKIMLEELRAEKKLPLAERTPITQLLAIRFVDVLGEDNVEAVGKERAGMTW